MADRRCPYCGELVPTNSITCPKCFKRIPAEPAPQPNNGGSEPKEKGAKSQRLALILAIVFGIFGFLGVGRIYLTPRESRGYILMLLGLLFFIPAILLATSLMPSLFGTVLTTLLAIPLFIIYGLLFIASLIDVLLGSMIRIKLRYNPSSRSLWTIDADICASFRAPCSPRMPASSSGNIAL